MLKNDEEPIFNISQKKQQIPDIFLEEFQNLITESKIQNLSKKLKSIEIKGYISHDKFIESMKQIFDESIISVIKKLIIEKKIINSFIYTEKTLVEYINEIYELYFLRFREIKCLIKNNKTVFYLTDYKPENFISSYYVICSLIIFMKSSFDSKIKLLFEATDVDEDGFLNENEIKYMISTCNFLFCEERNVLNTSSSILSQSLMNFKVNEILKQILYDPGELYIILEEEKYINFKSLYRSIIKVKDYKYQIIPNFINLKHCLKNFRNEKIIKINNKYKFDFINVSSALFTQKSLKFHKNYSHMNLSSPYIGNIIKPKKITEENEKHEKHDKCELPNVNKTFFKKRQSMLKQALNSFKYDINKLKKKSIIYSNNILINNKIGCNKNINKNRLVIEKAKTFKDLLKESTILDIYSNEEKDNMNDKIKNFNRSSYYNTNKKEEKYIFEANYDNIRNIEVEPGLIQFIGTNNDKDNISSNSGSNKNINNIINSNENSNKSSRKISYEKNINNNIDNTHLKIFKFSSKSLLDNTDLHNSVIKEEKSSEEQDNDNVKEEKKIKKIKLINTHDNTSNKNKNYISNTVSKGSKKRVSIFKKISNSEKIRKFSNYSVNNKRSSLRPKISILNAKTSIRIQRSIMESKIKEEKKYKTLDEVFNEINNQEKKINSDSYGKYGQYLAKTLNKIHEEQKDLKKLIGQNDKKDNMNFFEKSYYFRQKNQENEGNENISSKTTNK